MWRFIVIIPDQILSILSRLLQIMAGIMAGNSLPRNSNHSYPFSCQNLASLCLLNQ